MKTTKLLTSTPAQDGFFMPAEWHPHEATWLVWPKNIETWPDGRLEIVEKSYLKIIAALLLGETVKLLVDSVSAEKNIRIKLKDEDVDETNLVIIVLETVDSWIRDFGPTYLIDAKHQRRWCKWIFNAWGGKYDSLMKDTQVFKNIQMEDSCYEANFVLEGGSIEVNGKGTCLTTKQCLLNKNRNPSLSKEVIEDNLKSYLNVQQVIWLNEGVVGDDTDGHIDDIARFVDDETIVAAYDEDASSENYALLDENWKILENSKTPQGKPWKLVKLPMPSPVLDDEGIALPASYANFYIANDVVLVPTFSDPNDEKALSILSGLFPQKKMIGIPCKEMVYGMGTLHCLSQQEPKKLS